MKYKINPEVNDRQTLVLEVASLFEQSNVVLQDARNKIKKIEYLGEDYAVKSFKRPSFINSILYSFFRSSKAKRSYDYSLKIPGFVPKGIGYVEEYNALLLTHSYFVSELFDYDFTIRNVLTNSMLENREVILKAFAAFAYELHQKGVLHKDFSPGNILIKERDGQYQFKIIDINRMEFKVLSLKGRMKNFSMLWAKDDDLDFIVKEYTSLSGLDITESQTLASYYNQRNKRFKNFKKRLKGRKVND